MNLRVLLTLSFIRPTGQFLHKIYVEIYITVLTVAGDFTVAMAQQQLKVSPATIALDTLQTSLLILTSSKC